MENKYSQISDILKDKSIEELNNKAILFDKYGYNEFEKYLNYNKTISNSSIPNNYKILDYLLDYKKYIDLLKLKDEYNYMNKINSYKILCNKLINITDTFNLEKIF